jgi:magnesium-transporting ATPase (P-type)
MEHAVVTNDTRRSALLAIGVGGLVGATLDLLQACILVGHDIILVITYGLIGPKALQGGAANYSLGILLHVFISFCFATFYFAISRKLRFMTEYPLICGLCFGAGVHLVMMLVVLPLSALHQTDPITIRGMIVGLLIHMVVFGLPVAYSVSHFASQQEEVVRDMKPFTSLKIEP